VSRARPRARWVVAVLFLTGGVFALGWWAGASRRTWTPRPAVAKRPAQRTPAVPGALPVGLKGLPCFQCHNVITLDEAQRDIIFSHRAHLRRGAHCHVCHQVTGHTERIAPEMDTCLECHDGQRADDRCRTCHSKMAAIKPAFHDAKFLRTHGKRLSGRAQCRSCHENSYCDKCHKLPMPHPAGWSGGPHGRRALAQLGPCYQCHQQSYCDECHQVTMPHPRNYLRAHAAASRGDEARCTKCHSDEFCDKCHTERNPHAADWMPRHGLAARAQPESCSLCHEQSYCDECHKLPMPHLDSFVMGHGSAIMENSSTCSQCHDTEHCQMCHKDRAPPTHVEEFALKHGELATKTEPACILCHGIDFCAVCHSNYRETEQNGPTPPGDR